MDRGFKRRCIVIRIVFCNGVCLVKILNDSFFLIIKKGILIFNDIVFLLEFRNLLEE